MRLQTSGKYKFKRKGLPKLAPEHRAVMHEIGPREDEDSLVVHHIDGNKSNNDPSNLMWMPRSEHSRLHHLGENHFPCAGEMNANYKHGMCVNGHSKEYKKIHSKKSYIKNREARLEKQNAYGAEHREHKRWYDKHRYWQQKLATADSQEQKEKCLKKIHYLEENAV